MPAYINWDEIIRGIIIDPIIRDLYGIDTDSLALIQSFSDYRGLQEVLDTAVSFELSRPSTVAQSVSRNGRILTAARNTVKPWRFIIEPKPVFLYETYREKLEPILTADRHQEQLITLGNNAGQSWMIDYQGSVDSLKFAHLGVSQFTVNAASTGNTLVLNVNESAPDFTAIPSDTVVFKAGDIIQPAGHRYPYAVTKTVTRGSAATVTVILNRGLITQPNYTMTNKGIIAGRKCYWIVKVSKLPAVRLISGKFMTFTDNFELIESVI
jgi:hypothetical protein